MGPIDGRHAHIRNDHDVSILGLGSYLAARGEITVGEIVVFTGFSGLLIAKLDQISAFFSRAINQAPALMNFFELLDQKGGALESPNAIPLGVVHGDIRFENVTFNFPDSPNGVRGISFTAHAGETIALVGPSGSGKTTTLGLLQRLFDPQEAESCSIDRTFASTRSIPCAKRSPRFFKTRGYLTARSKKTSVSAPRGHSGRD